MKLAEITDGIVTNIIKVDPNDIPDWVAGWPDATGAEIGGTYASGVFAPLQIDPAEVLAQERANMVCTRQQGKLALGPTVWASVLAMVNDADTPWGLRVAIEDTVEWRRTDEDMQALVWAMGLTEEQADDLFRLAMTL